MIQATRKQMQKTSRTSTAVPLSGKKERREADGGVSYEKDKEAWTERDQQSLLYILWYDEKIDKAKQGS